MGKYEFTVRDPKTGEYPDLWKIAMKEEWAYGLMYCDMDGFAINEDGQLILMDECGNFAYCPDGRFDVHFNDEPNVPLSKESIHNVMERLRANFKEKPDWMLCKNAYFVRAQGKAINDIIDIVNEYFSAGKDRDRGNADVCMWEIQKYLKNLSKRAELEKKYPSKKSNVLHFLDRIEDAILRDGKEEQE